MAESVPLVEPEVSVVPIRSAPPIPDSLKTISLKGPNTLESADDCPVIVWGDYTYWPLSYVDNRVAICLVAYDLLNNVVNKWELTGARYVVTVTVNSSRQEITLLGQSCATVTVAWKEIGKVVPSNPQYFWILNRATHWACRAAVTNYLPLSLRSVDDDQLWLVDSGRQAIFPKTHNPDRCLDHHEPPDSTLVLVAQTNWGRPEQRWIINATGILKPAAANLVATVSILNSVVLQVPSATSSDNQLWYLKPYLPSPNLSLDQFSHLMPGESFTLSNQGQMLSSSGSGPLALVPDANSSVLWLCNGGNVLVNVQDGLAITASGTSSVIASPWAGRPEQQWSLTANGFLVCRANGQLMVGRGNTVVLSSYDALVPADQIWLLRFQQADASSGVVRGKRSEKSASSRDNITQLTVTVQVSNDFWAGTSDRIYISFGSMQSLQVLLDGPSRNDIATVTIDLNLMFGKPAINLLNDVLSIVLFQEGLHPIASDAWKLASIILKAKDEANNEFTNYTFQKVEEWVDNQQDGLRWVWSSPIPWGAWLSADQRPIDLNGATYPVGLIPYIGDLKSWRDYDPSEIDGVGQLLGMRDGRLIGELLKPPQQTEVLQPSDETHSYTWVFTPKGAIIYKLWDKQDVSNYIRHSQLGSGQPVICAGEMQMIKKKDQNNYIVSDVIAMVNDASGHYKPDGGACLRYVEQKLQELGIPTNDINWYSR